MKTQNIASTMMALLVLAVGSVKAGEIVGFNCTQVPANSDAFVSVPFAVKSAGTFTVNSTAVGIIPDEALEVDQFGPLYYVRVSTGAAAGKWSTIASNSASEITLENDSFLGMLANGDTFEVFKHHTLASVFPDRFAGLSFETSASAFIRATEVLIPSSALGVNKSASATYFHTAGEWRKIGGGLTNFDEEVLAPQSYFILRNNGGSELSFYSWGTVDTNPIIRSIPTSTQDNDVAVSSGLPVARTLGQLNLGGTAAFETSSSAFIRADELLVFDNSTNGQNKSAAATYFYFSGEWRKIGGGTADFSGEWLPAGASVIIRKKASTDGSEIWMQHSPF